jgi:hypothetical protein
MKKGDVQLARPQVLYKGTTAAIEALTGIAEGAIAYSTDDNLLGTYNGTTWDWNAHDYAPTSGWIEISATWTRTGNHTFTVSGDVTATYRTGTRVRYKDGGAYEYGVVQSSSYSAPNTTVTLATNDDYAMAAATITDTAISYIENPEGYPHWFNYTPTGSASGSMTYTVTTINRAKFAVSGRRCDVSIYVVGTTGGTASNTLYLTYPITPSNYDDCLAAATRDATTGPPDLGRGSANAAGLFCRKYDASNYGLNTGRYFILTGYYLL